MTQQSKHGILKTILLFFVHSKIMSIMSWWLPSIQEIPTPLLLQAWTKPSKFGPSLIQNRISLSMVMKEESIVLIFIEVTNPISSLEVMIESSRYGTIKLNSASTLLKLISRISLEQSSIQISHWLSQVLIIKINLAAEDGIIRFWHANTYKLEMSLNYNMERVWSIDVGPANTIAFGFDEGTVVVKLG